MPYFTKADHYAVLSVNASSLDTSPLQSLHNRLLDLHKSLHPRLRKHNIDLHPGPARTGLVTGESAATLGGGGALAMLYMRSHTQANVVEGMMGRDRLDVSAIEPRRHPVIELRLTPDAFTIELVIGPDAWHDQQNLIGKLSIPQHRTAFYHLLRKLSGSYRLGFWAGVHLDDMHINTGQMPPMRVFSDWIDTFAARRDWFRVGAWYTVEDGALSAEGIITECFNRVRDLAALYEFVAWSSNNNFHNFYKRAAVPARR